FALTPHHTMISLLARRWQSQRAMTTILVVDDEPPIVDLVRFTLEDADVRVVEAADGAEALVVARQTIPDLVLLDVHMPRLDGYEVSRAREEEANRAHDKLRAAYQQALAYAVDLRKSHRQMQRSVLQSLLGLANALEAKDEYTRGHSERVAGLAQRLALAAGLGIAEAKTIAEAGLLHDLGKIGVPEHILRKQGPLTDEEWIAMRRHPLTGAQIVAPLEFFADAALIV